MIYFYDQNPTEESVTKIKKQSDKFLKSLVESKEDE